MKTPTRFPHWLTALCLGLALTLGVTALFGLAPRPTQAAPPVRPAAQAPRILTVTMITDSGPGSLRWAILDANISDTITFDPAVFPPTNPVTITLGSPLPAIITNGLTINASNAGVILGGSSMGDPNGDGLTLQNVNNVTIQGLQIVNFPHNGIVLDGATHCLIGGNSTAGAGPIGQGNLISTNGWSGIRLSNHADGNIIRGNRIGTDLSGSQPLGNGGDGVYLGDGSDRNLIGGDSTIGDGPLGQGNLISANGYDGIRLYGADDNTIQGNRIGTDLSGSQPLGNGGDGVYLGWGSDRNLIGGVTTKPPGQRA